MTVNVAAESAALARMTMRELRAKFAEVYGDATASGNRAWLVRRILWRLQALAEGDLSERARQRAAELASDADLRVVPSRDYQVAVGPRAQVAAAVPRYRCGLPVGAILQKVYKGKPVEVRVVTDGFEFKGAVYRSLSAVARAITGAHWNGRLFFGLRGEVSNDGNR